jgi:uncharacterized damage-inducible protein DinB
MMNAHVIRDHVAYNRWATLRLLDAARGLSHDQAVRDFGTADKSVAGTLAHIFASDRIWLARVREATPVLPPRTPGDSSMDVILARWPETLEDWRCWAESLKEGDVERAIRYTDLRGQEWKQPLWQIVFHAVNHSTHHRGQVAGFLRAMGQTPPSMDYILFVRQQGA